MHEPWKRTQVSVLWLTYFITFILWLPSLRWILWRKRRNSTIVRGGRLTQSLCQSVPYCYYHILSRAIQYWWIVLCSAADHRQSTAKSRRTNRLGDRNFWKYITVYTERLLDVQQLVPNNAQLTKSANNEKSTSKQYAPKSRHRMHTTDCVWSTVPHHYTSTPAWIIIIIIIIMITMLPCVVYTLKSYLLPNALYGDVI